MKTTIEIKLCELEIHPKVLSVKTYQLNKFMAYSIKHFGQKTEVVVVEEDGKYYIIDGGHRYFAAIEAGNIEYLTCLVLDIEEDEILNVRISYNQKTKMQISEICKNVEHLLGLIGNNQGRRNDLLGMQNMEDENEFGLAGKDRFEFACMHAGLDFSARTLRKLMAVHDFEKNDNSLMLLDGIDNGTYKIDAAFKLMQKSLKIDKKNAAKKQREIDTINENVWFKNFEQSAVDLSNLKEYKPNFAMLSPTYWQMKEYRNQGEMKFGQEPTLKQYLENCRKFIDALIDIMDENGVIVIVIGESYKGGYKSITTQYEMMLLDAGLEILGVCEWEKINPTPVVVENFFRPANEKIFVCKMPGAKIPFNPRMISTKSGIKSVKKSQKRKDGSQRFYVEDTERIITNVITTPVLNPWEYKKYDADFTHDAPCPMEIYDIFTETYTLPGMTCIDIHCGAGQGLEVFARRGCNAIGVDIDPVSIEFCNKRMNMVLGNEVELSQAA